MRTPAAALVWLLALSASCSAVAGTRATVVLKASTGTRWGDDESAEAVPRRMLRWSYFDDWNDYETYNFDYDSHSSAATSSSEWPSSSEASWSARSDTSSGEPDCQTDFDFRLNAKGGSSNLESAIISIVESNMINHQLDITIEQLEKKPDKEGWMSQPNDCTPIWQASYFDVKFKVKTNNAKASLELQHFFETIDFAAELRRADPSLCGARLVEMNEKMKWREHDNIIRLPQDLDPSRKLGAFGNGGTLKDLDPSRQLGALGNGGTLKDVVVDMNMFGH